MLPASTKILAFRNVRATLYVLYTIIYLKKIIIPCHNSNLTILRFTNKKFVNAYVVNTKFNYQER